MTTTHPAHEEQLDEVLADYLARVDRGEQINLAEFCAAHPGIEAELQDFVEMGNLLKDLGDNATAQRSPNWKSTAHALGGDPTLADVGALPASRESLAAATGKQAGVAFGRYYLLGLLGEGSMGAVHLAFDTALDRLIALKMPRFPAEQSQVAAERFRREARASATVRHPHICPIFDVGVIDGTHFLSMAYIEGESLAQLLERGESLPLPRVLQLIRHLAEALQEAHRHDVVHRDLKPANIMLDQQGNPIITDFGLARRLDMRETLLTQSGMIVGTLAYMSPEQLAGDPDGIGRAADIYSLGVIFYQLLTGQLPYRGGFLSVVLQIREGKPQSPAELQPALREHPGVEEVCLKMMAADQSERYSSLTEVVSALAILQGEATPPPVGPDSTEAVQLRAKSPVSTLHREKRQHQVIALLGSIAVMLLLAIGFFARGAGNDLAPQTAQATENKPAETVPPQAPALAPEKSPVIDTVAPPTQKPSDPHTAIQPNQVARVAPVGMQVKSRRYAAKTFGVVELQVTLPADAKWEYRPDWTCRVSSADQRVFYPTYQFELAAVEGEQKSAAPVRGELRQLTASFLTYGEHPLHVDLNYAGQPLLTQHEIPIDGVEVDQPELLNAWWASYTQPSREPLNDEARQLKTYLHEMLAWRLNLPVARPIPQLPDERSMLQKHFERSIGSFLGFDSVKAALGEQGRLSHRRVEQQNQPLPTPPRIAPVPFPKPSAQVAIEAIASHVPEDCVYLRCQSLENYLWFRDLLLGWGGGLNEVVSPRRLDPQIRERLERQLAIAPNTEAQAVLKAAISDLALMFGDTCFEDGAAVGVLFQAKDETQLRGLLAKQRERALQDFADAGASEMHPSIAGHEVSLLTTSDQRLRSYYAVSGKYHLVTNSEYLVRRFFECSQGIRTLQNLEEFKYARTKVRLSAAQDVFLYMPDPFFHRTIAPQHQIELGRRRQAKADIQHVELARLAAFNEGLKATRVKHLVDGGFLPTNFGARSDGTYAVLKTAAEDSARGVPGTFVPIVDIEVEGATPSEVEDYWRFSQRYRSEYRMMDPVAVVASHRETDDGRQEVDIEITITPYALQTYAVAREVLSTPRKTKIAGPPSELLSLQGSLRTSGGIPFLASAAVHDTSLKFKLIDGQLQVDGYLPGESFAGRNWQLVFDRQDPACMDSLLELIGDAGGPKTAAKTLLTAENLMGAYVQLLSKMTMFPLKPREALKPVTKVFGPGWDVRSPREDLQKAELKKVDTGETHQVRLELKELEGSQIEPYIQAYTWLEARRASTKQAALAELTMQQFGLPAEDVLPALEKIYSAKILCPLDGQLELALPETPLGKLHGRQWCSSRWTSSSVYDETAVPAEYRFAFTDWLRNLSVGFSLEGQTLSADMQLEVRPRPAK